MIDIKSLNREMCPRLVRISRLRILVRILTIIVYTAILCWFAYCTFLSFFGWRIGYEPSGNSNTWVYFMGGFGVFCVLHFALMNSMTNLKDHEIRIMRKALRQMFPNATYSANSSVSYRMLKDSALFGLFNMEDNPIVATGYGCIKFQDEDHSTSIYDIGVTSDKAAHAMYHLPVLGYLMILYRTMVRPIFGTTIESSQHSFRGMFGAYPGLGECKGNVILLPDHLEDKIGYFAHSIQSYKHKNGARHVILEDPEFENLFEVYADDEVEARKILTPAIMRRITKLRQSFGKDMMLSFSGNMCYYAVPIPNGFLRPSRKAVKDRELFEQIFQEINLAYRLQEISFPSFPVHLI
ncbi:MAG: DUF3137 domain-containing protein [Prevotella sp.]|nr:DUF3137 domain-containing protein [Prevotella sp.]